MSLPTTLPNDAVLVTRPGEPMPLSSQLPAYSFRNSRDTAWLPLTKLSGTSTQGRYIVPRSTADQLPSSWTKIPCHPPLKPPRGWRFPTGLEANCRHIIWDPEAGGWQGFRLPDRPITARFSHIRVPLGPGLVAWYPGAPVPKGPVRLLLAGNRTLSAPSSEWHWGWGRHPYPLPGCIIAYETPDTSP